MLKNIPNNVVIKNKEVLIHKIKRISSDYITKKRKLFFLADFDYTLTAPGSKTSWSVIDSNISLPDSFRKRCIELAHHYYPFELSLTISQNERQQKITEWFNAFHSAIIGLGLSEKEMNDLEDEGVKGIVLREGSKQVINTLIDKNIDVCIVTAGQGRVVDKTLQYQAIPSIPIYRVVSEGYDKSVGRVVVVGNYLRFGKSAEGSSDVQYYPDQPIHVFSKCNIRDLARFTKEISSSSTLNVFPTEGDKSVERGVDRGVERGFANGDEGDRSVEKGGDEDVNVIVVGDSIGDIQIAGSVGHGSVLKHADKTSEYGMNSDKGVFLSIGYLNIPSYLSHSFKNLNNILQVPHKCNSDVASSKLLSPSLTLPVSMQEVAKLLEGLDCDACAIDRMSKRLDLFANTFDLVVVGEKEDMSMVQCIIDTCLKDVENISFFSSNKSKL